MTPAEKAKELYKKFDDLLPCEGTTTGQTPIECALVCVDEILQNEEDNYKEHCRKYEIHYVYDYWSAVKTEIEKL